MRNTTTERQSANLSIKSTADLYNRLSLYLLKAKPSVREKVFDRCVESNILDKSEATQVEYRMAPLTALSKSKLYWLHRYSIEEGIKGLGLATEYFTRSEIEDFTAGDTQKDIPIVSPAKPLAIEFNGVVDLQATRATESRQFGFYLTVGELKSLVLNNKLKFIADGVNLERLGADFQYKNKPNDTRVDEISMSIRDGRLFYNTISLALVANLTLNCAVDTNNNKIILNKGDLVVIDGRHRLLACTKIKDGDAAVNDKFHIILTIASMGEICRKIVQEYNTEYIYQLRYNNADRVNLINYIIFHNDLDPDIGRLLNSNIHGVSRSSPYRVNDIVSALFSTYRAKKCRTVESQRVIADNVVRMLNKFLSVYGRLITDGVGENSLLNSTYVVFGLVRMIKMFDNRKEWDELVDHCFYRNDTYLKSPIEKHLSRTQLIKDIETHFQNAANEALSKIVKRRDIRG